MESKASAKMVNNKRKYYKIIKDVFYAIYKRTIEMDQNESWNDRDREKFIYSFEPYPYNRTTDTYGGDDYNNYRFSIEKYKQYIIDIHSYIEGNYIVFVLDRLEKQIIKPAKTIDYIIIDEKLMMLFILILTNEIDVSPYAFYNENGDQTNLVQLITWVNTNKDVKLNEFITTDNFYDALLNELLSLDIMKEKIKMNDVLPPFEKRMKEKEMEVFRERFLDNLFNCY